MLKITINKLLIINYFIATSPKVSRTLIFGLPVIFWDP